ncbi:30S ribosomal protein S18 [Actinomycetospora rhizophila]|uniref:Small ribosomal subunit protein bS18 n=1 Tax=Actinomycetospora rhizophila TaxID=1416876 RepID=A0ABV9ZPY9_9PSEU
MSRAPRPPRRRKPNPLRDVETVDWSDVSVLRTFVSDRGKIRSRRVTGLTGQQQRRVATAIRTAREMALLPYSSSPGKG